MSRRKHADQITLRRFLARVARNLFIGCLIIAISLAIGMAGYSYFEGMSFVSSFENAAMILSGMGPVDDICTQSGKFFAGSYALFSGVIFLIVMAIIMAPIFHRFFHKFLVKDTDYN